jgi:glycosyltransferase involved in cell wall biosynthesis
MARNRSSQFSGRIEFFDETSLTGWINHRCEPDPPELTFFKGRRLVAEGVALQRRRDVEQFMSEGAVHGFTLPLHSAYLLERRPLPGFGKSLRIEIGGPCGCKGKIGLGVHRDWATDELVIDLWDGENFSGWIKGASLAAALRESQLANRQDEPNGGEAELHLSIAASDQRQIVSCRLSRRSDLDAIFGIGVASAFSGRLANQLQIHHNPVIFSLLPSGPEQLVSQSEGEWRIADKSKLTFLDLPESLRMELIGAKFAFDLTDKPEVSEPLFRLKSQALDPSPKRRPVLGDQAAWHRLQIQSCELGLFDSPFQLDAMDAVDAIEYIRTLGFGYLFADGESLEGLNTLLLSIGERSNLVPITQLQFAFWFRFHRELDFFQPQQLEDLLFYFLRWIAPVAQGESLLLESQRQWLQEVSFEYDLSGLSSRLTDAGLRFHSGPRNLVLPGDSQSRTFLLAYALLEQLSLKWVSPIMNKPQHDWFTGTPQNGVASPIWERSILHQMHWFQISIGRAGNERTHMGDKRCLSPDRNEDPKSENLERRNVQVVGLVGHPSGVGHNADLTLSALSLAGFKITAVPIDFYQKPVGQELIYDSTLRTRVPSIIHAQPEYIANLLTFGFPKILQGPVIGFFSWEMDSLPPEQKWAAKQVDEIWVPSEFSATAFRENGASVEVVHHAVDVSGMEIVSRETLGIPQAAYIVHFAFDVHSTIQRKNPAGVIRAFRSAFDMDESAYLLLKVRNYHALQEAADSGNDEARGLLREMSSHPRIVVAAREMSRGRTLGLLALSDCHLSLHRAEGFGYGMAEAMALGVPVVATGYSGNMAYMDQQNSWPVDYKLKSVLPGEYLFTAPDFRWAEPCIEHAADQLRRCRLGSDRIDRIYGARNTIESDFSLEVMSVRMSKLLERFSA